MVGSQHNITWSNVGEDSLIIHYSTNNGSNWSQVARTLCAPNSYSWTIPNTPSTQCLVRVTSRTGVPSDQSNAVFTIYEETGFSSTLFPKALPVALSASPNPFTSRLSLSLPSPAAIYSLTGSLIKTLPKGKHEMDTSSWKAGVYLIKCGKETKRVVKLN